MATDKRDWSSYSDLVVSLRTLTKMQGTGTLYVMTNDNLWAGITLDGGDIQAVSCRGVNGMGAVESLREIETCWFRFENGDKLQEDVQDLPGTEEIIKLLAAADPSEEAEPFPGREPADREPPGGEPATHEPAGDGPAIEEAPQAASAAPVTAGGTMQATARPRTVKAGEEDEEIDDAFLRLRDILDATMPSDNPISGLGPSGDPGGPEGSPLPAGATRPERREPAPAVLPPAGSTALHETRSGGPAGIRVSGEVVRRIVEEEAMGELGPIGLFLTQDHWRRHAPRNLRSLEPLLESMADDIGNEAKAREFIRRVQDRIRSLDKTS